jgi:DNA primase
MLSQAKPLWMSLPEGALRIQLLSELARLGGMPAPELSALWQGQGHAPRHRPEPPESLDGEPAEALPRKREWLSPEAWRAARKAGATGAPVSTGRRLPPKRPEDRVVQLLFGQPGWWEQLSHAEHDLLHGLPAPHGPAIAWLERDIAEHGPRPWAVLRQALGIDEVLPPESRALADGDADPDATEDDLHSTVGRLLLGELNRRLEQLAADPELDLAAYRALTEERNALNERLKALTQRSPNE